MTDTKRDEDLVERLLQFAGHARSTSRGAYANVLEDAADEIERLRGLLAPDADGARATLAIYDRVHQELDAGKGWTEINLEWQEGKERPSYEAWQSYMQQRLINDIRSAPTAPAGWGPIVDAPKDSKTVVDIWAVDRKTGKGWRVADCTRAHSNKCWINSRGNWFTGKRYWDRAEEDELYDPTATDELSIVATHFMIPPAPPKESAL